MNFRLWKESILWQCCDLKSKRKCRQEADSATPWMGSFISKTKKNSSLPYDINIFFLSFRNQDKPSYIQYIITKNIGGFTMSDLTATGCSSCSNQHNNGCGSWIWIIILLFFCGGCNGGSSLFGGNGCGCDNDNNSCEWLIILLVLFSCCGNNSCGCVC